MPRSRLAFAARSAGFESRALQKCSVNREFAERERFLLLHVIKHNSIVRAPLIGFLRIGSRSSHGEDQRRRREPS